MKNTRDLKYFMREQQEEVITAQGPSSICDEEGNPITLEIRVLNNTTIQKIFKSYSQRSIAMDGKGNPFIANGEVVFKTEKDNARAVRHIIAEALVYPDLKDKDLMGFYKCHDISEMAQLVFSSADEYAHVSRVVMAALGLGAALETDALVREAKN